MKQTTTQQNKEHLRFPAFLSSNNTKSLLNLNLSTKKPLNEPELNSTQNPSHLEGEEAKITLLSLDPFPMSKEVFRIRNHENKIIGYLDMQNPHDIKTYVSLMQLTTARNKREQQ